MGGSILLPIPTSKNNSWFNMAFDLTLSLEEVCGHI